MYLFEPVPKSCNIGTHRLCSPEATISRVKPFAAAMGITRIGNITGLDVIGIPVAIAVRPLSRVITVSQGKGVTVPHALASALMESVEGFHGERIWSRVKRSSL